LPHSNPDRCLHDVLLNVLGYPIRKESYAF
jgi:hypothetical protein